MRFFNELIFGSLPLLLVLLAAGVLCLRRLTTQPREGWLVGAAIGLSLFDLIGTPNFINLILALVPGLWTSLMAGGKSTLGMHLLFGLPSSIVQAAAWGLILYAAFGEGSGPRSKYLVEDERTRIEID